MLLLALLLMSMSDHSSGWAWNILVQKWNRLLQWMQNFKYLGSWVWIWILENLAGWEFTFFFVIELHCLFLRKETFGLDFLGQKNVKQSAGLLNCFGLTDLSKRLRKLISTIRVLIGDIDNREACSFFIKIVGKMFWQYVKQVGSRF